MMPPLCLVSLLLSLFAADVIAHEACSFATYPSLCVATAKDAGDDLVSTLVEKAKDETLLSISPPVIHLASTDPKAHRAVEYCDELMRMSVKRFDQSLSALKFSPVAKKEDIQTWLSAVLSYQDTCKDAVDEVGTSLTTQIATKMEHLSMLASNALALANRIAGVGRLLSEDGELPRWVADAERRLSESEGLKPDAVVAQDGSGDYLTIADALEAVKESKVGGRRVISIKAGVYKQKLTVNDDNVMLVGEGKGVTKITNDASVGGGTSMPNTATVVVNGDGFFAKDISIENSAGAANHQALALRIASDHAVLYNVALIGHQDTLYAMALRQFYKSCDIYGSIDYIFGNAAAVFQSCNLLFQRPKHAGINTVTAQGRTDPGQNTGFVIQGCNIGAGPELAPYKKSVRSYLGRPWKAYARVVVMQSNIDDSIQPSGWKEWSGSFALKTLYYAEYGNSGPGSDTSRRVNWPGFHVIGAADAAKFTVSSFISGGSWIPATGVSFKPGL